MKKNMEVFIMEKIDFFKSAILNCISLVYIMKNVEKGYKIYY